LYSYAKDCDFPGNNTIKDSCSQTETDAACATRCYENEKCKAFIAVTTSNSTEDKYLCCLKQEVKGKSLTEVSAEAFADIATHTSVCGVMWYPE
jgi:hypothetical protein